MGVGGRGKCPGAPSHHLRKAKGNCNGKSGRPKGTVKSRMAKNGNGNKKKKKKIRCRATNHFKKFFCFEFGA
jgi:hypothetical protein